MAARPLPLPDAGTRDEAPGVVASIERIDAWLSIATPGSEFVYATRAALPIGSKAAAHLRQLAEAGEVDLFQRRCVEPGLRNYVARRRASPAEGVPTAERARPVTGLGRDTDVQDEDATRLLAMLRGLIRNGLPYPTDALVARQMNLSRPSLVRKLLDRLVERGAVTLDRGGRTDHRIVTLVATGKRTATIGRSVR